MLVEIDSWYSSLLSKNLDNGGSGVYLVAASLLMYDDQQGIWCSTYHCGGMIASDWIGIVI